MPRSLERRRTMRARTTSPRADGSVREFPFRLVQIELMGEITAGRDLRARARWPALLAQSRRAPRRPR